MSTATADPTLEALVPRGSARRNALLVAGGLVLLAAVWFLPPLVRPSLGTTPGGSWQELGSTRQVVLVAAIEPHTWGGLQVREVTDVPGAHVVAAWATDADLWQGDDSPEVVATVPPEGSSAADRVAALGLTDGDRLPRTVASDGEATLVVLWQVDDCTALTDEGPQVVVGNRWGFTSTDTLRYSPFGSGDETDLCGS